MMAAQRREEQAPELLELWERPCDDETLEETPIGQFDDFFEERD